MDKIEKKNWTKSQNHKIKKKWTKMIKKNWTKSQKRTIRKNRGKKIKKLDEIAKLNKIKNRQN